MAALVLAMVCVPVNAPAAAGDPTYAPATLSLTNYWGGSTGAATVVTYALSNAPSLGVLKQQNVAISSTIWASTSGATNTYYFAPSVDQVNYDTNAADLFVLTNGQASGNGPWTVVKSFAVGGIGSLKLIEVTTLGTVTNSAHSFGEKISSP